MLRGIGAGISSLLRSRKLNPRRFITAATEPFALNYKDLGGTDRVQARLQSLRGKAENALDARSLPPAVRFSQDWLWEN